MNDREVVGSNTDNYYVNVAYFTNALSVLKHSCNII